MGSLAGHIIECGTQGTGGLFTDWRAVADGWDNMGYPIVECSADGSFVVTKPAHTGGLVTPATVAEQITYEIHDPAAYKLPDVVCDLRAVHLEDLGNDRVRVSGARGWPPTADYKASLTWHDGFRCMATMMIVGRDATARARHVAEAILRRTRRMFAECGYADYRATSIEVLGAESLYGPHASRVDAREVVLKIAVAHAEQEALELFSREIFPAATSMAQSITGFAAGRPSVQPVVRLASCLVPKSAVSVEVEVNGRRLETSAVRFTHPVGCSNQDEYVSPPGAAWTPPVGAAAAEVPLGKLAWGRSGDKGDTANIGVIARRPEFVPVISAVLTPQAVRAWLAHLVEGEVERFDWPGINGWSFVLRRALGGGGVASLRYDPQGKSYAQILMDFPIGVPSVWLTPEGGIEC
jgi:hypothetical protein